MATSLQAIAKQIKALEAQAEKIRKSGAIVLKRIRKDVARFGFTVTDVFGTTAGATNGTAKTEGAKGQVAGYKVPPKYRDGDQVWTGRGSMPKWLSAALKAGRSLDSFLIEQAQVVKPSVKPKPATQSKTSKPKAKVASTAKPAVATKANVTPTSAKPAVKVTKKPAPTVVKSAAKPPAAKKPSSKKASAIPAAGKKPTAPRTQKKASSLAAPSGAVIEGSSASDKKTPE